MDPRIPQKDPNYVDVISCYHIALFVFALLIIPQAMVTAVGLLLMLVMIVIFYVRRRKARLGDHEHKQRHVQLLITQFWRLGYLSLLPLMLSATITSWLGDASALQDMRARHEEAGTVPTDTETMQAVLEYQIDNGPLIFWSNFLCFLPLLLYILAKTYDGYRAYHRNLEVNPKSWGFMTYGKSSE